MAVSFDDTLKRDRALEALRAPLVPQWQDVTTYLVPYAGRYLPTNRDQVVDDYTAIINECALNALEIVEAGMMAMRTSPARPWFRFLTRDPELNKHLPVKLWFRNAEEVARFLHRKSNTNLALTHLYNETASFGTGATIQLEDHERIMHQHILTIGEYKIGTDGRGRVDTLYRRFCMSVWELVSEFGRDNVSSAARSLFANQQFDTPIEVLHAIEPRKLRDYTKSDVTNMPWRSTYYEVGTDSGEPLRDSGFNEFPCLVPRWRVTGNNTWGTGLGVKAMGSLKQLQAEELQKANAMAYQADPPAQVPTGARGMDRELMPGGRLPIDQSTPYGGVRTAYEVPLRLDFMAMDIEKVEKRIRESFFVNLFQPVSLLSDTTVRTAAEMIQRRDETLTVLGPVTQRMQNEIDEPLLRFTFQRMIEENLLPPPPEELLGMEVDIEFDGPLAQALKAVDAQKFDKLVAHIGQIAPLKPEVLDRYDADKDIEIYADMIGADPSLIVAGEKVAMLRKQRAQAESVAAQAQVGKTISEGARNLAQSGPAGVDALAGVSGVA